MCNGKDVNRRWLSKAYREHSSTGNYFTGTNTREVAINIANTLGAHPSYVGKIDDLLAKLIAQGAYKLSNGQLITCEAAPANNSAVVRLRDRSRRRAKRGKQQYRDFALGLHREAAAAS